MTADATKLEKGLHPLLCVLALVAVVVGVKNTLDPFTWRYSNSIALLTALGLATYFLKQKGTSWASFGLVPFKFSLKLLGQTGVAAVISLLASFAVIWLFDGVFETPASATDRFGDLTGDVVGLLWWLILSWVVGGFAEEMVFRGAILTWIERGLGVGHVGLSLAVFGQAALFGAAHIYYKGVMGGLITFSMALSFGVLYIWFDRTLWPLIIAHGSINSISFIAKYFGSELV
jgi:membrane protease YdiL (CAAX protease family)